MEKKSKSEVEYGKGMAGERCGLCEYFEAPGSCELVAGRIGADMWCKLYSRREKPVRRAA